MDNKEDLNYRRKQERFNRGIKSKCNLDFNNQDLHIQSLKYKNIETIKKSKKSLFLVQDDIKKIKKIKEEIKNINLDKICDNWTVTYRPKFGDHRRILLNPHQDCSQDNPLYTHKKWLEKIYNNKELQLTDQKIAEICGVQKTTIGRWRKRHDIPTKEGNKRSINKMGYVRLSLPIEYQHPELKPLQNARYYRLEHSVVMENYLSKISDKESLEKFSLPAEELKRIF